MNYEERDTYGMYKGNAAGGPPSWAKEIYSYYGSPYWEDRLRTPGFFG